MKTLFVLALVGFYPFCAAEQPKFTVSPNNVTLEAGQAVTFKVKKGDKEVEPPKVTFQFKPSRVTNWNLEESFDKAKLVLKAPDKIEEGVEELRVEVAVKGEEAADQAKALVYLARVRLSEWEARAIAGYHQAGASSANYTQNFFFDFFIMRGLGSSARVYDSSWNLWGNVRVASAPQQVNTSVAEFAAGFATQAGAVKVNELAQSAEFQLGFEKKCKLFDQGARQRMLGFIAFVGASGSFTEPSIQGRVFEVPQSGSPQLALFQSRFPNVKTSHVGFVPPDRRRFYRMYGAGLRLTSFDTNSRYAPPANLAVTLGQDESITGGGFQSVVGRFDCFYPLPVGLQNGKFKFLFLFGTANLRMGRDKNETPLVLKAESIPLFDPRVSIVTVRNTRDTYRLGVGIDFVNLLKSWLGEK